MNYMNYSLSKEKLFVYFEKYFIKIFGEVDESIATASELHEKIYINFKKLIGPEARQYWFDELYILITKGCNSDEYKEIKQINDAYFDFIPLLNKDEKLKNKLFERLKKKPQNNLIINRNICT